LDTPKNFIVGIVIIAIKTGKYPQGYFIGMWTAIFSGKGIEEKMKKQGKIRPLTKKRKASQKNSSANRSLAFNPSSHNLCCTAFYEVNRLC